MGYSLLAAAVLAALLSACGPARGADDLPWPAPAPPAAGPEVRDPFFAFCVALAEGDSLGVWRGPELAARFAATGRRSKLPVETLVSLERREVPPPLQPTHGDRRATRRWRVELDADLARPLPYSILGYHPGTLHVSRVLEALEWVLPGSAVRVDGDDGPELRVGTMHALRLEVGHVILDADGLVDKLLGKKLDDTWTEAFVLARVDGAADPRENGLNGVALGRARNGRPLSGAFDFRRDEVLPNGRPAARALSGLCRPVVAPYGHPDPRAWSWRP
ncbi:MAG: hypothetical protein Q7W56_00845 [Candidatus Latescibacteria bacterium]|nr:hypothetical protein [Candidatus Latescibacterota bacterium]